MDCCMSCAPSCSPFGAYIAMYYPPPCPIPTAPCYSPIKQSGGNGNGGTSKSNGNGGASKSNGNGGASKANGNAASSKQAAAATSSSKHDNCNNKANARREIDENDGNFYNNYNVDWHRNGDNACGTSSQPDEANKSGAKGGSKCSPEKRRGVTVDGQKPCCEDNDKKNGDSKNGNSKQSRSVNCDDNEGNFYNNYNVDWHRKGNTNQSDDTNCKSAKGGSNECSPAKRKGVTIDGQKPCCDDNDKNGDSKTKSKNGNGGNGNGNGGAKSKKQSKNGGQSNGNGSAGNNGNGNGGSLPGCPTGFKPCTMKLTPPPFCHPLGVWHAEIQPCPPKESNGGDAGTSGSSAKASKEKSSSGGGGAGSGKKSSGAAGGRSAAASSGKPPRKPFGSKPPNPKDEPCLYDKPCKAHCFNHPPGMKPSNAV